jgi:hypothetical protein
MRAMLALVLHLGGVGKCMRLIWEWSVHNQESGDLHTLAATFIMWGNNVQKIGKSKNKKGKPEEGNPRASGLAKMAVDLGANRFPDARMSGSAGFMVGVWVVFGAMISPVFGTSIPVLTKLVLRCAASKPPEAHIHHLGPARHNRFVGNTDRGGVISLDRSFWLWPSHSNEGLPVGNHFLCHDKKGCKF